VPVHREVKVSGFLYQDTTREISMFKKFVEKHGYIEVTCKSANSQGAAEKVLFFFFLFYRHC
jgi:hypothetical protein